MSQYTHYPSSSLPPYGHAPLLVAPTFEAGLPVASSSSAPASTAAQPTGPPYQNPAAYPYAPPYAAGLPASVPPPVLPPASSVPPVPPGDSGLAVDDPAAVPGPLLPVKGDWTTHVALPLSHQVPPGGTYILPAGSGLPRGLAGGTELVKVTGKVRCALTLWPRFSPNHARS